MELMEIYRINADGLEELYGRYDNPVAFAYAVWDCSQDVEIADVKIRYAEVE